MSKKINRDCAIDPDSGAIKYGALDEDTLPRINGATAEGNLTLDEIGIHTMDGAEVKTLIDTCFNDAFYTETGCVTSDPESIHVSDDIDIDDI